MRLLLLCLAFSISILCKSQEWNFPDMSKHGWETPLDNKCRIKELNKYSKSYLNHLIKSDEMLASMLISLHNLYFYQQFMREIRENIKNGTFKSFYKKYINFFD